MVNLTMMKGVVEMLNLLRTSGEYAFTASFQNETSITFHGRGVVVRETSKYN